MQHVILGLLMVHGPLSLYAVQRQFTQGVSLFYSASFGSIQRALRQLLDRGLVTIDETAADGRGRKPYTVTDAGIAAWREWMHEPVVGGDLETTALSKTFFLGLLDDPASRREVIDGIRARIETDLAELRAVERALDATEVPAEYAEVFRFQRATLDYGLRSHEQARAWFGALSTGLGDAASVRG
ncbi:MAG: PadR family transcriptional regulator [Microbacterium sp.]